MAGLLFSGGKDSALAALCLEDFYDVTCVTVTAGVDIAGGERAGEPGAAPVAQRGAAAAEALGLPHETVEADPSIYDDAVERLDADGFPRNAIQQVHEHALERVAERFDVVADGTRRDDRAPIVSRPTAQSLEDRHGVDYVRPLAGFGRSAIDDLAGEYLAVESGPSEELPTADYETELRALLAEREGPARVDEVFPEHVQSRVVGRQD